MVALFLMLRVRQRQSRDLARLIIDDHAHTGVATE
jgi:hypothetical protein